jgi:hypothetical protein
MIYKDDFKTFLEQNLEPVKDRPKNFICRCPWCEMGVKKKHYHLWIGKTAPIFHCFHCGEGGVLSRLLQKIAGTDVSEKYIDKELVKKVSKEQIHKVEEPKKRIQLPELDEELFHLKYLFMKKRLGYTNAPLSSVKGLILDVNKFWEMNNIPITPDLFRMKDFLQQNFVGFLTEGETKVIFRNIDLETDFRYYKYQIRETEFLDYYKLVGSSYLSNQVILAEGIFDILSENTFDNTGLKNSTKLYAAALSKSYSSLLKSIAFNEQIFKMRVVILSDKDVELEEYKKLKKYNGHIIESLSVYYNKNKKDFGETPVLPEKFII